MSDAMSDAADRVEKAQGFTAAELPSEDDVIRKQEKIIATQGNEIGNLKRDYDKLKKKYTDLCIALVEDQLDIKE